MVVVNCISHVEFISTDREILYEIAHTSKKDTNKLAKIAVFFCLETDVLYGRTIFLLKWSTNSREAWL